MDIKLAWRSMDKEDSGRIASKDFKYTKGNEKQEM